MLMPSLTPIVLNRIPTRPAAVTPSFTLIARSLRCMLHVFPSYQTLAMPTWALFMSSGVIPVPNSIACDAPWLLGWVILLLYLLSGRVMSWSGRRGGEAAVNGCGHETRHVRAAVSSHGSI